MNWMKWMALAAVLVTGCVDSPEDDSSGEMISVTVDPTEAASASTVGKADTLSPDRCVPQTCQWRCGSGGDGCGGTLSCDPCGEIREIAIAIGETSMVPGQLLDLEPVVFDDQLRQVIDPKLDWVSSRHHVASVNEDGEVFAMHEGSTVITVEVGSANAGIWVAVTPKIDEMERKIAADCDFDDPSC